MLTRFCSVKLSESDYRAFEYALRNRYWYQMYIGKKIFQNLKNIYFLNINLKTLYINF